ncbi:hypothetical protein MHYP_G00003150 [Metynnis hypsauchen]
MNLHLAVCFLCVAAFSSAFAQSRRPSNCCLSVSRITVRLDSILDYRWQDKGLCPVTAVVFETRRRNKICADPNRDWTKRAMRKVTKDKERKEAEKSKKDSATLTSVSPAEGTQTPTKLPVNSRILSVAEFGQERPAFICIGEFGFLPLLKSVFFSVRQQQFLISSITAIRSPKFRTDNRTCHVKDVEAP